MEYDFSSYVAQLLSCIDLEVVAEFRLIEHTGDKKREALGASGTGESRALDAVNPADQQIRDFIGECVERHRAGPGMYLWVALRRKDKPGNVKVTNGAIPVGGETIHTQFTDLRDQFMSDSVRALPETNRLLRDLVVKFSDQAWVIAEKKEAAAAYVAYQEGISDAGTSDAAWTAVGEAVKDLAPTVAEIVKHLTRAKPAGAADGMSVDEAIELVAGMTPEQQRAIYNAFKAAEQQQAAAAAEHNDAEPTE